MAYLRKRYFAWDNFDDGLVFKTSTSSRLAMTAEGDRSGEKCFLAGILRRFLHRRLAGRRERNIDERKLYSKNQLAKISLQTEPHFNRGKWAETAVRFP